MLTVSQLINTASVCRAAAPAQGSLCVTVSCDAAAAENLPFDRVLHLGAFSVVGPQIQAIG